MYSQIGTDEAGYGPNLGPLTVTGTLWQIGSLDSEDCDLYQLLSEIVCATRADQKTKSSDPKVLIADSKLVHSTSKPLQQLELAVLTILKSALGETPKDWQALMELVSGAGVSKTMSHHPWMSGAKLNLPVANDRIQIEQDAARFSQGMQAAEVSLHSVHCEAVFPDRFNLAIEKYGNKASLLSATTLNIVRELMNQTDSEVEIGCDKHGGRSRYAGLIGQLLTEEFVYVDEECLEVSRYHFTEHQRNVRIRFAARGESFLPTAFASMVSKYVREVMMILWNDFWQVKIPELKPTKGYPLDAKRFKSEIAAKQIELGISDHVIWRNR